MQVSWVPTLVGGNVLAAPGPSTSHPMLGLRHLLLVCGWAGGGTGAAQPLGWWQHMCHPCTWLPEG